MPQYLIQVDEDKINAPISNKFIQSIFGHHASEEPLLERLASDYGVSLRSREKHPPVYMENPMHDHIRKHIPKTCKVFLKNKGRGRGKGHDHGHDHGHGHCTLKKKHCHIKCN